MKTAFYQINTKGQGLVPACACSKTSISINKFMQKAGEPEDDAVVIHIYPSKPRLQWLQFLDCTSMVSLNGCFG